MTKYTKSNTSKDHILLVTGGTGGHIFPAISVAEEFTNRHYKVSVIMDKRGAKYFPLFKNISHKKTILCKGINNKSILHKFLSLTLLALGILQSFLFLIRIRPSFIVGFGGYFSFPPLFAARLLKIPYALHEQNSVLGLANRTLLHHARFMALSFKGTDLIPHNQEQKCIYTGIPIRHYIAEKNNTPYTFTHESTINLFIVGGSLGAKIFMDVVPQALIQLPDNLKKRLHVVAQMSEDYIQETQNLYQQHGISCEIQPFFYDIPQRILDASLIISRAGSSTLSEIATINRPCLFVPLPHATNDHQQKNVQALIHAQAALTLRQKDFTPLQLSRLLTEILLSPEKLHDLHKNLTAFSMHESAKNLCDQIINHL